MDCKVFEYYKSGFTSSKKAREKLRNCSGITVLHGAVYRGKKRF